MKPTTLVSAILLASVPPGCSQVVSTSQWDVAAGQRSGEMCRSALGHYFLPRALVVTTFTEAGASYTATDPELQFVPDGNVPLCLDYLASSTSDDVVSVKRTPEGLLAVVTSNVVDRTPSIAETLVNTLSNLAIAEAREGIAADTGEKLNVTFDPFDSQDLRVKNRAMARFGYCLFVEGYSFDASAMSPEQWCSRDYPVRPLSIANIAATAPVRGERLRRGILYRPNISYKMVMYRKLDPDGPEPWRLYLTKWFDMPNLSPVLAVDVKRALFSTRKTRLEFNKGVLADVTVEKGSEALGFVAIPLVVAKAIVDVPAQIVKVRLTDTKNETALLNAQIALMQAVDAANKSGAIAEGAPGRSGSEERSAAAYAACLDANGPPDACAAFSRSTQ